MLWLCEFESTGVTICRASLNEDRDPAFRYRLVKRLTGLEWRTVRARGLTWLLEEFVAHCRPIRADESYNQTVA
jgi:hypothetical protein